MDISTPKAWPSKGLDFAIERQLGKKLGFKRNPLLLSALRCPRIHAGHDGHHPQPRPQRSNRRGTRRNRKEAFAYGYRRFIQMYGDVVMGVHARGENESCPFEAALAKIRSEAGVEHDNELSAAELKELIRRYKAVIQRRTGNAFPQDVHAQLWGAVGAVFEPGRTNAQPSTVNSMASRPIGAPQSISRLWFSATWATPALRRRLHPQPAWRQSLLRGIPAQCSG